MTPLTAGRRRPLPGSRAGRRRLALAGAGVALLAALAARPALAASPTAPTAGTATPALTAAGTSAATGAGPGFAVGISPGATAVSGPPATVAQMMSAMAAAGDRWVRLDVPWSTIEPLPGVFLWSGEDTAIGDALAHGMQVDALLDSAPMWAMNGSQPDPAEFAAFAAAVVHRYAPRGVNTYEIWNEENLISYWGAQVNPAAYGRLLQAGYLAVHAADPNGFVVLGGLGRTSGTVPGVAVSPSAFLTALYQGGFGRYFDAAAVHPYSYPYSPTSTAADNALNTLAGLHTLMASYGDGAKKIWVTEYGYPTGVQLIDGTGMPVSPALQASYLAGAITRVEAEAWAGPFFVFSWQDDLWQSFGLLRSDGSPKPALAVFEAAPH